MWRTLAVIGIFFSLSTVVHAAVPFPRTLKIGMSGEDVRALQVILNKLPETRIAQSGVGSPGQETTYFGPKTQQAVARFQEKYRSLVLTPNALTRGTGYVGPSTLALLNKEQNPTVAASVPIPAMEASKPRLPGNIEGLPGTLTTLERVAIKQGLTEAQIEKLKRVVTEQVQSTTTPLLASFAARVYRDNPGQEPLTLQDQLINIGSQFLYTFVPKSAHALDPVSTITTALDLNSIGASALTGLASGAGGGIPFGGAIVGTPIWCLCSASWWIPITPLPPTMAEALAYVPGSQAFLSYNIPAPAIWLLGFYAPGQCLIYTGDSCAILPVNGIITPIVGSSPI